jgi:WD40 repeat protein
VARRESGDKLRVWRIADGSEVLIEPPAGIEGQAFSSDSRHLIVGQRGEFIRFELTTGREINRWKLPEKAEVWSIELHPDNRRAAVCYADAEVVSIYDTEKGELVADLPIGPSQNPVVAWHPDGTRLAVGASRFIQIWDVETRIQQATLQGHDQQVESLSFHPNGSLLASRSWDGVLRLTDFATGRALLEMPLLVNPHFSRDGRWLGVLRHGEDAQLLEAIMAPDYRTFGEGEGVYLEGDLSPNNQLLAVNRDELGVHIWDLSHGRKVTKLAGGLPIFRPDGRELFVCNADGLHRRNGLPSLLAHCHRTPGCCRAFGSLGLVQVQPEFEKYNESGKAP